MSVDVAETVRTRSASGGMAAASSVNVSPFLSVRTRLLNVASPDSVAVKGPVITFAVAA